MENPARKADFMHTLRGVDVLTHYIRPTFGEVDVLDARRSVTATCRELTFKFRPGVAHERVRSFWTDHDPSLLVDNVLDLPDCVAALMTCSAP